MSPPRAFKIDLHKEGHLPAATSLERTYGRQAVGLHKKLQPLMAFNLDHLQHRVVFFLFLVIYVFAAENVTVDDQNPSIIYSPPRAWSESAPSTLDLGGSHKLTQNPNATASFNFTGNFFFDFGLSSSILNHVCCVCSGIAIYFLSPLWPYTVNTAISLDSGPSILVNLVDTSRPSTDGGPETVQSSVVWNATGLANIQHNLLISVGAGQPYAIVDGLMYVCSLLLFLELCLLSMASRL